MTPDRWEEVDRYLEAALVTETPALTLAREAAARKGLPDHQVAANQGALLMMLAGTIAARRILEVGTLGGYSTLWLARALPHDGAIDTLEVDSERAAFAREIFAEAGASRSIAVHEGDARETLTRFQTAGREKYDFVFIDADKPSNPHYLEAALALSHPGSLIVVDNVVRDGKVADAASDDANVKGVREMFEMIRRDPRLEATALQTVGSKGWDGFALMRVVA